MILSSELRKCTWVASFRVTSIDIYSDLAYVKVIKSYVKQQTAFEARSRESILLLTQLLLPREETQEPREEGFGSVKDRAVWEHMKNG